MTPELIKLLFLSTDATNEARLHLGEQAREICARLQFIRDRDRFAYAECPTICIPEIIQAIQAEKPGVVHFAGHGSGTGGLRFQNPGSTAELIPTAALSVVFEKFTDKVKCVVLNRCHVVEQAKVIAQHIDYVIGIQDSLSEEAAQAFLAGFYEALGAGRTVKQALARGKVQLFEYNLRDAQMPVLFMRDGVAGDFPIFGPPSEDGKPDRGVNLPTRNEIFTGREEQFEALRIALKENHRAAISGIGGIGKTALSVEYAYRHADDYDLRLFCRADSVTSLYSSYKVLAERLGLTKAGDDFETIVNKIKNWLGGATTGAGELPYLLILDNADFNASYTPEDLKAFLPENMTGHLLLTARSSASAESLEIKTNPLLDLDVMQEGEAVQFLAERVRGEGAKLSGSEGAAAAEIAHALGFLPLALELAASYLSQHGQTFLKYLPLFHKRLAEQSDRAKSEAGNERKAVAATWSINAEEIEQDSPAADLLTLSAFLAPDAIPARVVFAAAAGPLPSLETFFEGREEPEQREEGYYHLLGTLKRYGLVAIDVAAYAFSVHRLAQIVQREEMSLERRVAWVMKAVETLTTAFPSGDTETFTVCERLVPHIQAVAGQAQLADVRDEPTAALCTKAARYLFQRMRYEEAEKLYIESLQVYRRALPPGHLTIAGILDNLAENYKAQGRYSEAEPLLMEALQIRRDNLLVGHPDIAQSLNNLALLYEAEGRHDAAEALLVESLQIVRNALPEGHPDIVQSLNNLGNLYMYQERYNEAGPLYLQVMEIRRASLPKDHPDIASSLNNVAGVYKYQNRQREAEQLYREALYIFQNSLGDSDHKTRVVAQNLQILLDEKKESDKPRDLFGTIKSLFAKR